MSTYDHLPAVPDHWDTSDWQYVFDADYTASGQEWLSASPPPKVTVAPVRPEDVAEVTHIWSLSRQEWADQAMAALMRLRDGRWASVETWSDSSGYGCRDGTTWHIGSREDVIRWGLSDEARRNLGIESPSATVTPS